MLHDNHAAPLHSAAATLRPVVVSHEQHSCQGSVYHLSVYPSKSGIEDIRCDEWLSLFAVESSGKTWSPLNTYSKPMHEYCVYIYV